MDLKKTYKYLARHFDQRPEYLDLSGAGIRLYNYTFHSTNYEVLPGASTYYCRKHDKRFHEKFTPLDGHSKPHQKAGLYKADYQIEPNQTFRYSVFVPQSGGQVNGIILLLHGLNEKYWAKYLTWAWHLVQTTGKAVILFPLAFHMNRAPSEWSNPRLMRRISDYRKNHYEPIIRTTFANAAMSTRLQMIPQRFFWSGMQTYRDLIQLTKKIRTGTISALPADGRLDLFTYSIGSFLAEILFMVNPEKLFDQSKLFIFCGGPTLDGMNPVSKYIMDSQAQIALYSFYIQHLTAVFEEDERLAHYFGKDHETGTRFRHMLNQHMYKSQRENRLRELSSRINAVVLEQDEVIPPIEVENTLKGSHRDIPIDVEIMDFPYSYNHVNPFPMSTSGSADLNKSFNRVFEQAGAFLT